jgi:U6 snRNA-associated Sm-like protein LSm7
MVLPFALQHWFRPSSEKKLIVKFILFIIAVIGLLKGYDQLMNLVMDEVEEYLRGKKESQVLSCNAEAYHTFSLVFILLLLTDPSTGDVTEKTRPLGLAVVRGTALTVINPAEGFGQISNPFLPPE